MGVRLVRFERIPANQRSGCSYYGARQRRGASCWAVACHLHRSCLDTLARQLPSAHQLPWLRHQSVSHQLSAPNELPAKTRQLLGNQRLLPRLPSLWHVERATCSTCCCGWYLLARKRSLRSHGPKPLRERASFRHRLERQRERTLRIPAGMQFPQLLRISWGHLAGLGEQCLQGIGWQLLRLCPESCDQGTAAKSFATWFLLQTVGWLRIAGGGSQLARAALGMLATRSPSTNRTDWLPAATLPSLWGTGGLMRDA